MSYWIVFIGAGLGGMLRHAVNLAGMRLGWTGFPAATLTVNVVGSLAMGLIAGTFALRADLPQAARLFLTTGVLGGFTTFSTYAVDIRNLVGTGHPGTGLGDLAATLCAALAAVWRGTTTARPALARRRRCHG